MKHWGSGGVTPRDLYLGTRMMRRRVVSFMLPAALPPKPTILIEQDTGWAPEPVWTRWRKEEKFPATARNLNK